MPIYDELLGDVTDQERMARAAQRLQRRETFATLAAMSGDPYMGPWGQQSLRQLPQQAQGLAQARQQAASHLQRQKEHQGLEQYRQQQIENARARLEFDRYKWERTPMTPGLAPVVMPNMPGGPTSYWAPGVQEALKAKREHEKDVAQTRANVALQSQMELQRFKESKMPQAVEKQWRDNQDHIVRMGMRLDQMRQWDKEGEQMIEKYGDIPSHIAGGMVGPGAKEFVAETHKNRKEMQGRSWIAADTGEKRTEQMGTAQTAYEGAKGSPWDPAAPGISQKEALQRYEDMAAAMFYANAVLAYGLRIPGVKEDPYAIPAKPVNMSDEEFAKFNQYLYQAMSMGGGYAGSQPPTQILESTTPTTPETPMTPETPATPATPVTAPVAPMPPTVSPSGELPEGWSIR